MDLNHTAQVVSTITAAVMQSGGDMAMAFEAFDTDQSGGISSEAGLLNPKP
jgi:hypothetical protein